MTARETASGADYKTILADKKGAVFEIWLNRPEARNAMNSVMEQEFIDALDRADDDPEVKVVTLRGKGPVFSAGHDLKETAARERAGLGSGAAPKAGRPLTLLAQRRHNIDGFGERAWYCRKTLIAAVHGYAGTAAWVMLDAFDFVLAAEGTRFSREQARAGSGSLGSGFITPFLLPLRVINKMNLLGGWMDAETARELHYVQRVVPFEKLGEELDKWAEAACALSVAQIVAYKEGLHRQTEIRGLTGIVSIGNQPDVGITNEHAAFFKTLEEKGLREALRSRDAHVDPSVTKV